MYVCSDEMPVREEDVKLMWSQDQTKCGVTIWGRMRGVLDITNGRESCLPIKSRDDPGITDVEWLKGFDDYLDLDQFLRARGEYWKQILKETITRKAL